MADILNLNKARKKKARQDAAEQAARNRVIFGRSKEQKQRDAAEQEETQRRLDGLRREPEPPSQD